MRLSTFSSARDVEPKEADVSWGDFLRDFAPHRFDRKTKLLLPAVSPAIYAPGDQRSDDNVLALSSWWGDFDHLNEQDALDVLERIQTLGWSALAYTTWRHHEDPMRFRVVVPFTEEVRPEDWPLVWASFSDALGGHCDPKCTDLSRIYFAMYAPPGTQASNWHHVFQGSHVDPHSLRPHLEPLPGEEPPEEPTDILTRETIEAFAKILRRKSDPYQVEMGRVLSLVTKGEAFAEPGNIDNTLFKLCAVLAERFPQGDPESVGSVFALSLQLMAKRDPAYAMTSKQAAKKFAWCQDKNRKAALAKQQEASDRQKALIADAFGNGRTHPYTDEELRTLGHHPRWLVQKGRSYYTLISGQYKGPYIADEAFNVAIRDLAPAVTAGVELFTITRAGEIAPKPLGQLVREYGYVVDYVAASLSAQKSYLDEPTKTLVEAPCPLRPITPKYHPLVDEWLGLMAGIRADYLRKWIAAVTLLEVPCTALFLTGAGNTGKSLLARGLARLWVKSATPTPLQDVITGFNDALLDCPLVFADETLPTDHRGRVMNAELRQFIQERSRKLRRKYLASATMTGAARLIIAANNEEVLSTTENLSNHDISATVERYLHIPTSHDAIPFLKANQPNDWVEQDLIAQHALWLRDNLQWKSNGRFLVQSDDRALQARLATGSGVRSAVCQFLVSYLMDPGKIDNDPRGRFWIRVYKGWLYANTQALVRCWDHYVTNERCPTTGRLAAALSSLSVDGRLRLQMPDGKRPNYRQIDPTHLFAWADRAQYATREELEEALQTNTEDRVHTLRVVKG